MLTNYHRGRRQTHESLATTLRRFRRANPRMLPGPNASGLGELTDKLGQQLVRSDQHRQVALANRVGPAFRFAIWQLRSILERRPEASAGEDRLSGRCDRPQPSGLRAHDGSESRYLVSSEAEAAEAGQELRRGPCVPHPEQNRYDVGGHARTASQQVQRRSTGGSDSYTWTFLD